MTTAIEASPQTRRRSLIVAITIPVLLLISLVAWAFATPVGSSPDDDFHLPSIWCGLGERPGLCEATGDPDTRLVPAPLTDAPCFAFKPDVSGSCWNPGRPGTAETSRVNLGLYPPLFYGTMSLFVGDDVQVSVIVMRIVNSTIAVGLLSAVFFALPRRLRPALIVSSIGSAVPLGLSVVASTNPSSWAYISAATVWICLYGAAITTGRRRWALAGLAVFGAILGAGSRADAAAYAVLAVLIAAVLGARLGRSLLAPAVAAIAVVIVSIGLYLSASQSGAVVTGLAPDNPPLTIDQHISNFLNVPALLAGALGGWGLGWLDTYMPAVVSTLSMAVAAGAVFLGIRRLSVRRGIAFGIALVAMYLVPFVLLVQSRAVIGTQVQPRYILPLIIIFLGVASAAPGMDNLWRGPRIVAGGVALTVAFVVALHVDIRRYTTGVDDPAVNPGARAEWWWTGFPHPGVVWIVGSVSFAAAFVLLALVLHRRRPLLDSERETTSA
ncbi:DUF2142 domain-containing protein [uncultured Microbacterium sp.]|uniref:DUF2142 domain-containing protein n=1 Tax=uncultured Microbacterium sp. TaxID=191216 RepID=UPI0035CAF6B2